MGEIAATTICQGLSLLPLTPLFLPSCSCSMGIAGQDREPCTPRCRADGGERDEAGKEDEEQAAMCFLGTPSHPEWLSGATRSPATLGLKGLHRQ